MKPAGLDLADLAERFGTFFIDQFGVLHDGSAPYAGAVDALVRLKEAGKRIVLLSNSGKRSVENEKRLISLGFRAGSWDLFLTSGEVARRMFTGTYGEARLAGGARVLVLSRGGDSSAIDGLDVRLCENAAEADLVLLSGSEGDRITLDDYRALLAPAAKRNVPLICTNPDKIMLTPVGPRFGSGRVAELYEAMGGTVTWIGKPFPQIYAAALSDLGVSNVSDVVCVGDSVEHDIAGAHGAGLQAALVRSGIIAGAGDSELEALYAEHGTRPDFVLPAFAWRGRGETG
ncbi:MAG: TIGR01459 family HAD-type hydrolase [Rhizobiaceae bacterium]|nr:TIGR01459 family HAD-type hydrolase [Rhizobiaceae bacterium]